MFHNAACGTRRKFESMFLFRFLDSNLIFHWFPSTEKVIEIDLTCPEDNEPVFVFPFQQFKYRDAYYTCYDIQVVGDLQEMENDLHVIKHENATDRSNRLVCTKPGMPLTFDRDKGKCENQETVNEATVGQDQAQTAYMKNKSRHEKSYMLQFPSHFKLSNDPFRKLTEPGDQELEAKLFILPFKSGRKDKSGKDVPAFSVWNSWKVIDLASRTDVGGDADAKKKGATQLDDIFAGLEL